ncbi:MAG: hypothetical protein WD469_12490 [Paenibacillaceae bacterium]
MRNQLRQLTFICFLSLVAFFAFGAIVSADNSFDRLLKNQTKSV